jgi:hypothetical protein
MVWVDTSLNAWRLPADVRDDVQADERGEGKGNDNGGSVNIEGKLGRGARVHEVLLLWMCEEVFERALSSNKKPTPGIRLRGCLEIGVLSEELRDQAIQTPAQQSMRHGMQQYAAV